MNTRRPRTSCTPCRSGRIGCDAAIQKPAACSNCVRRGKVCDLSTTTAHSTARRNREDGFSGATLRQSSNGSISEAPTWDEGSSDVLIHAITRASAAAVPQDPASQFFEARSPSFSDSFLVLSPSTFDATSIASRRLQATMLNGLLWDIYFKVFELRNTIWLGNSCSPYLDFIPKPRASIIQLILQLDTREDTQTPESQRYYPHIPSTLLEESRKNPMAPSMINEALLNAIYAYAVRWLPLASACRKGHGQENPECQHRERDFRSCMWRRAKQTISYALTRPTYRSILALLLFTSTEIPIEDEDPGFVQLCNQTLFSHLHMLRTPVRWLVNTVPSRQPSAPPNGDRVVWCVQDNKNEDYDKEPDHVFWLCVSSGCSRTLLRQQPSLVLPGNSGDDQVWKFIRKRTVIFDQSFRTLQGSQTPLTPEVVETVLQHATACKMMYIHVINQLCDSLFHHKLLPIEQTAQAVIEEARQFQDVFGHLLTMCARDYIFLKSESRLNYLLLVAHYHLASLTLMDVLDSLGSIPEPLNDPVLSRSQACQAIVNTMSLILTHDRHSAAEDSAYGSPLLLDPSPELMAEVLLRTGNTILILNDAGEYSMHTTQTMLSIIFSASTILSEISRKAALVLAVLRRACRARKLKVFEDGPRYTLSASTDDLAALAACDAKAAGSFLQEMQVQCALNTSHLSDMVKLYEDKWICQGSNSRMNLDLG